MPTVDELIAELGIEIPQEKKDVVTKWNGYFTDADNKLSTATKLQKDAEENLRRVQEEQKEIQDHIAEFGASEADLAALRANNAAMAASLEEVKKLGFTNINIPEAPKPSGTVKKPNEFDPQGFRQDVNATLVTGFDVMNRYQRLYGKALPDDIGQLANEANAARKPFAQYVSEKYDFAGEQKRQQDAAQKAHDEAIAAAAVKKYQEDHPNVRGNPELNSGRESQFSEVKTDKTPKDLREYSNMTDAEKLRRSKQRVMQVVAQRAGR